MTAPTNTPASPALDREAVEALKPLAAFADWWEHSCLGDDYVIGGCRAGDGSDREVRLTLGDARRARNAILTLASPPVEDRGEIERLSEAVQPLMDKLAETEATDWPSDDGLTDDDGVCVSIGSLRAIRAALPAQPTDGEA